MVTITLPSRGGGSIDVTLPARGERPTEPVGGGVYLTATDVNTPAAFQAAITANPNAVLIAPTGTRTWDMMSYGVEVDIAAAGALIFPPGFEIVSNCPVRGILRASGATGLRIEGFRGRWEFDGGDILRPDLAWNESNDEMFDWIDAWNAAFGTSISTAINGQGFNQRWDNYYTALETEAWNQISAGGRASGLLLNGCNEIQIYDFFANNCVAQINDQGGTASGDGLDSFGSYIDQIKMGDDQRFGYLGKRSTALKIDRVICDVNGIRDNGGAPHILYFSGNPTAGDTTTALDIGSIQIAEWGIAPAAKFREASVNIGSIVSKGVQSVLGMVHCTGSVGPVTCTDQKLARDEDGTTITAGSGSKFAINLTNCYDLSVGRVTVQQRASTGSLTQDNLRVADLAQCTRIKFEGFDVSCHRLSTAAAMVRLGEVTHSHFGVSSITNTGTNTVNLYEMPVDDDVGGANTDNYFAPVRTSANAQVALLEGASKRNTFTLDPRLLTGGFEEDVNVQDLSFGASNNIALVAGERIVPITSAPSFETKANDTFLANYTDDDEVDGDVKYTNFAVGNSLTIDGRTYTFVSALTGNDQILRSSSLTTNLKRVRAAMNGDSLSGEGNGVIYQTGSPSPVNHATYFGVSSGRALTVINRTAGSAGNGDVMTATGTNGAWVSGTSVNGGELDTHHLNATLAITTSTSNFTFSTLAPAEGTTLRMVKTDSAVGSFAFGDFEAIRRQNDELRVVYTDGAWRGIYMPSVIRGISHGDVFIPEALTSAAINDEIARMGTRDKLRLRSGKTYAITSMLNFDGKSVLVDADGALLQVNANVAGMRANSGIVGPFALTSNYTPGGVTLTVASTTGLRVGSWVKIVSDAVDPGNRNEGVQSAQWRMAEWRRIVTLTSTVITMSSALEFPYALSGELTPADPQLRSTVETYTTANNARVFGPALDYFVWEGGTWAYEDGHDATDGTGWRQNVMQLGGWDTPTIEGVEITRAYNNAFNLATYCGILRDCRARNLSNKFVIGGSSTNLGYGVSFSGYGETAFGGGGSNCRHVTTTSSVAVAINNATEANLYAWGPTMDASFIGMVGEGRNTPPFGTHTDAIRSRHISCRVNGSETWMFDIRGRDNWLIDCGGVGERGVQALTEWANAGAPDEPGCSGQGRANLTSVTISGLDIKVRRDALMANGAHMIVTGESKIECDTHSPVIMYGGGLMEFTGGRHRVLLTGRSNSGDFDDYRGVFTCDGPTPTEFGIVGYEGLKIHRGASVEIDATLAADTATMRLFNHDSTSKGTTLLGDLTATLNSNFDTIASSGTVTIDNNAGFTISGFTGTRETRSYFHTHPSGVIEGSGFVNDLADDGYVNITVPVSHGVVEVFLANDAPTGVLTSVAMSMAFNDSSSSTSERASLLTGDTTYCEVLANSRLNAGEGTDGKLVLSFYNQANTEGTAVLAIKNRLGAEHDVYWTLRGTAAFGSV